MISATRSASSPAAGSWSRTPSSSVRAADDGRQGVGVALVGGERLAGRLGGRAAGCRRGPSRCSSSASAASSPGCGRHRLDLAQAEPQQVGLAGPLARGRDHVGELVLGVQQRRRRGRGSRPAASAVGSPAEGVEGVALGARLQQAVLVGLTVHGHQRLGHLGQLGDRHRRAPDVGARAALGRDVAGEQHVVVLDLAPGRRRRPRATSGRSADPHGALDPGARAPRADGTAVGPPAEQQAERGHHHGLAGAGLAGDHGQARARARASPTR